MPLSDAGCRAARPRLRPYKVTDGLGLFLLVRTNGSRLWRFSYRFDGKQKTLAFGAYPIVTLGDARERCMAARRALANGRDPTHDVRAERQIREQSNSFESIAREWHANRKAGWVEAHSARILSRMERDVFPEIGPRPIAEIAPAEVLSLIRKVEARGALDVAKRIRQSCGQVFRYAIAAGKTRQNPAADLQGALRVAPKPRHFASLKASQLPEFLHNLADYDGGEQTRLAINLALLTLLRTKELRLAKWEELEGLNGETPVWRVPADRMKAGREHVVPLSRQAIAVLCRLRALADGSDFIFPGRSNAQAISGNTMIFALYRMGYHSRLTIHGFRGTASTILNEHEFNRDWIELQLAHSPRDSVRAAYNSAEWVSSRRLMMQWWADYLEKAVTIPSGARGIVSEGFIAAV